MSARRPMRRGFVLLAVLVVVGAAILVATGAIFTARAATSASRASQSERALRAAALDGVAQAAELIAAQRLEILAGAAPKLDRALLELSTDAGTVEVTLAPVERDLLAASEGAKLDLNEAGDEAIARLAAELDAGVASLLEAARAVRPLASVDGTPALAAEGERGQALEASLGALRSTSDLASGDAAGAEGAPSLVALFTVHAREPLVDGRGAPRIDLVSASGLEGEDRAEAALAAFDDAVREVLEQAARAAAKSPPSDDGALARLLVERGVSTEEMLAVLDQCTLLAGGLAPPRLDIARADRRVLAALEAIGPDRAARIADVRDTLDAEERASTAWLVTRRIMTPSEHAAVAALVTHRSTAWRIRVEARLVRAEEGGEPVRTADAPPLAAFDCIVDVAGERPRLAYLRDISLLPTARLFAAKSAQAAELSRQFEDAEPSRASESAAEPVISQPDAAQPLESRPASATLDAPPRAPRGTTRPVGRDIGAGPSG